MKTKLRIPIILAALLGLSLTRVCAATPCFECTQVIGYSQVGGPLGGWFVKDGIFESIVGNDHWQLLWQNGATLNEWRRPNHPAWSNPLDSPCASNSAAPDRVLLNLSGTNDTDVAAWADDINATIETIKLKLPSVRSIILQSIIGGLGHQTCEVSNQSIRASVSHPYMDQAIALVVAERAGTLPEVVAGLSPEVRDCSDYRDDTGHLTEDGAIAAAETIGAYYSNVDAGCGRPTPQFDWGDAPPPYPTRLAANGARHGSAPGLFLGALVDAEPIGLPSPLARGDDTNNSADEDGVTVSAPLMPGAQTTLTVTASAAGLLDAWVDFDADGDWSDAGEQISASQALVAGANNVQFTTPASAAIGATFARFRFSSVGNLAPTGSATDGEVEDYRVMISAPLQSNLFAGLRFAPVAEANILIHAGSGSDPTMVITPGAQPNSGVSFELGQASGLQLQMSMQRENQLKSGLSTRFRGSQGGQSKDLVSAKWELSEFDASKNEVSIETLEIVHEGLLFEQANVRFFDTVGRQIPTGGRGGGASQRQWRVSPRLGARQNDMGMHPTAIVSDTARFADSPPGNGLHLVVTLPAAEFQGTANVETTASAAAGTGHQVTLADGEVVECVALGVVSFEGLKQPVEFLERAEISGTGGLKSFELTDVGLIHDGLRVSGSERTRLGGFKDASQLGFYFLPEVGDEVVVLFAHSAIAKTKLEEMSMNYLITEIGLPGLDWKRPGSSLTLETEQTRRRPANLGVIESVGTKYTMLKTEAGYSLQSVFKGEVTGIEPYWNLRIFNQGAEVTSLVVDRDLDQPDMALVGTGKPIRILPGLRRSGEISVQAGITFDAPMTISFGDKVFVGDELSFKTLSGMDSETEVVEFRSAVRLRSPGQTEYRLTPEEPWDWGDLPSPYMTTLAQNGARHRIVPGLRLGRLIDPEHDGRSSPFATGDDRFLSDDEDGVTFTSALVPGANTMVNIAVVAPKTGAFIDAFIDLFHEDENTDGDFDDPGEKILDKKPVVNGVNTFTFLVPANAKIGKIYARFRLSSTGVLNSEGPANDGEIEDYIVRITSAAPPTHPSGLAVVPRGGANLRTTTSGGVEVADLTDGGDGGVTLLAPSNVVSRAAGRILLPLNPPIPLSAFTSVTRPFADGLVLEAHYSSTDGNSWMPQLKFLGGDPDRPVIVAAIFAGQYGGGEFAGRVRICAFGASGYVGSSFADSGDVGSFSGDAKIVRLGWATFPASALVILDQNVTFTGADGAKLTGDRFRFLALDDYGPFPLNFAGVSLYGANPGGGLLGFSDLTVRNPKPPALNSINLQPNGTARLTFPTEPDVFYSLEATESLVSPNWKPPTTAYQFGSSNASSLISDPLSGKTGFYRLRVE